MYHLRFISESELENGLIDEMISKVDNISVQREIDNLVNKLDKIVETVDLAHSKKTLANFLDQYEENEKEIEELSNIDDLISSTLNSQNELKEVKEIYLTLDEKLRHILKSVFKVKNWW